VVKWLDGVRIVHVPAGPPQWRRKEDLLPLMGEFTAHALRRARRAGYDLVHANFFMSALAALERRRLGIPFVVTFHALGRVRRLHQGDADGFPPERLAIEERAVAEADAVIAECPQDRDDLVNLYHADPRRLRTIPCGFDPDELGRVDRAGARAARGVGAGERVVLQLGRMVPRKGVDNVVRGLARLHREHGIAARLLVVGGESRDPDPAVTPELGRLRDLARAEGVAERVTFAGSRARHEVRTYYAAADVFVTTPWYEPFGITPVEAMACGTPPAGPPTRRSTCAPWRGRVSFLSLVGDDAEALRVCLREHDVPTDHLLVEPGRRTLAKTRVCAAGQILVRLDQGDTRPIDLNCQDEFIDRLGALFASCDAVVISDYGYGLLTAPVIAALARLQERSPRVVVVDSKQLTAYSRVGGDRRQAELRRGPGAAGPVRGG
jgi:glycosyltransferase involved in cell wall biosynthesis